MKLTPGLINIEENYQFYAHFVMLLSAIMGKIGSKWVKMGLNNQVHVVKNGPKYIKWKNRYPCPAACRF